MIFGWFECLKIRDLPPSQPKFRFHQTNLRFNPLVLLLGRVPMTRN